MKPHVFLSPQTAIPFAGAWQGMQDVPHVAGDVSSTQLPSQSCLPVMQTPLHDMASGIHMPAQSFRPAGHTAPHLEPSQVAVPPAGFSHFRQLLLHASASSSLRHSSPHR